jgi:hypothetical protein
MGQVLLAIDGPEAVRNNQYICGMYKAVNSYKGSEEGNPRRQKKVDKFALMELLKSLEQGTEGSEEEVAEQAIEAGEQKMDDRGKILKMLAAMLGVGGAAVGVTQGMDIFGEYDKHGNPRR